MPPIRYPLAVTLLLDVWSCGRSTGSNPPTPTDSAGSTTQPADTTAASSTRITAIGGTYAIEWKWTSPLTALGSVSAQFTIRLPDSSIPKSVTEMDIDPWMPSMGHGTYRGDQKIATIDPAQGLFQVDGLYFTMGGPWELRIDATVQGTKDRVLLSVDIP